MVIQREGTQAWSVSLTTGALTSRTWFSKSWRDLLSAGRNRGEPWVSNQEGFMEEQSGQQGWKRMEGQSWGGFSLGVRGRQISWPG